MADESQNGGTVAPSGITPDEVNGIVNSAVTSQLKRFMRDVLESNSKQIEEGFAKFKSTPAAEPHQEQQGSKKSSPELSALEQRLQDMQKLFEEERTRREAAEKKAREDGAYNELRSMLDGKVRGELKDVAARDLFHAQRRVTFDENGNPLMKIKRSPGGSLPEEDVDLPLADGVAAWLKTKEAAAFIPAPGGQGGAKTSGPMRGGKAPSGYGPGGIPKYDKPASTDEEKVRRAMEVEVAWRDAKAAGRI